MHVIVVSVLLRIRVNRVVLFVRIRKPERFNMAERVFLYLAASDGLA